MLTRTRFKLIVYLILLLIALSVLLWWFLYSGAKSRDYERLADMKILQSELALYFFRFNTYQIPRCALESVISSCGDSGTLTSLRQLADLLSQNGYQYFVKNLSEDNFAVSFSLETGIGGLPAGTYLMTKEGVKR